MSNVAIYYKMSELQQSDDVIEEIKDVIQKIGQTVTGVHIDSYNETDKFSILINQDLSTLDCLFINKSLEDEFDRQLIKELSRTLQFDVVYFNEI